MYECICVVFSHLMDYIIDEAVQDSELHKLPDSCSDTAKCLNFVQVWLVGGFLSICDKFIHIY